MKVGQLRSEALLIDSLALWLMPGRKIGLGASGRRRSIAGSRAVRLRSGEKVE
jgi:hypothetical protein